MVDGAIGDVHTTEYDLSQCNEKSHNPELRLSQLILTFNGLIVFRQEIGVMIWCDKSR